MNSATYVLVSKNPLVPYGRDGHRGLFTHYPIKGEMTIPNISSLDRGSHM